MASAILKAVYRSSEPLRVTKARTYLQSPWPDAGEVEVNPEETVVESVRKTNVCLWCCAVLCIFMVIATIICGIVVLILYFVFQPKPPLVRLSDARLLDLTYVGGLFNARIWLLLTVTNPSKATDLDFEYVKIDLYCHSSLVAVQMLQPFMEERDTMNLKYVGIIASGQALSPKAEEALMNEYFTNRTIQLETHWDFKFYYRMGHLSKLPYWHSRTCTLVFHPPPNGTLIHHPSCVNG